MESQIDKILSLIQTKSEAGEVLLCLENFAGTIFMSKEKLPVAEYFSRLKQGLADELISTFTKEVKIETDRHGAELFLKQLQSAVRDCKILQLTIAFHPDAETIEVFSSWIKKNIANNILLDIQIDKTIGAGALIIIDGKYKDYSIRKKISSIFQIQKEEILGLLTQVK